MGTASATRTPAYVDQFRAFGSANPVDAIHLQFSSHIRNTSGVQRLFDRIASFDSVHQPDVKTRNYTKRNIHSAESPPNITHSRASWPDHLPRNDPAAPLETRGTPKSVSTAALIRLFVAEAADRKKAYNSVERDSVNRISPYQSARGWLICRVAMSATERVPEARRSRRSAAPVTRVRA